jgi:hypothetical protein
MAPRYVKRPPASPGRLPVNKQQGELFVKSESEIDGIGMGVLSDGTPFLNQRGLARMCGVKNAHIGTISSEWGEDQKPRIAAIKRILIDRGHTLSKPHIEVTSGGRKMYAYTDAVCLAILEYYAFDAGTNIQPEAKQRYRWLAGRSLKEVIYAQVGYEPDSPIAKTWQQFHDRVSLIYDNVPPGYFCVFKEIADLMVTLINVGAPLGHNFLPDVSVGRLWSDHWKTADLEQRFGSRVRYEHNFPDYFPQAASNPQSPYCYPEEALAEFRRWMRETYLSKHVDRYLKTKAKEGKN